MLLIFCCDHVESIRYFPAVVDITASIDGDVCKIELQSVRVDGCFAEYPYPRRFFYRGNIQKLAAHNHLSGALAEPLSVL
jgi:hypothetical protein